MTRTTTEYNKRPDGWRKIAVKEVNVESKHKCARCTPKAVKP